MNYMSGHKNNQGLSVVELMVSVLMLLVLMGLGVQAVLTAAKNRERSSLWESRYSSLSSALLHLTEVGRLAKLCSRVSAEELQCDINFIHRTGGPESKVRFRLDAANSFLLFEEQAGGTWKTKTKYPEIHGFEVCSNVEMAGGSCQIPNPELASVPRLHSSAPNRFFRVRLESSPLAQSGALPLQMQSAFYVRHPTALPNGVTFLWGNRFK